MKYALLPRILICFFLLCSGSVSIARAASYPADQKDNTLRASAQEWLDAATGLTRRVQLLAANREALELFTTNTEFLEYMQGMGELVSADTLRRILAVAVPQTKSLLEISGLKMVNTETWELIKNRFTPSAIVSALNGREGMQHLASCQVLQERQTYVMPRIWTDNLLLIFEYKGYFSQVVAFWQSGENTVTGETSFILTTKIDSLLKSLEYLTGGELPVESFESGIK